MSYDIELQAEKREPCATCGRGYDDEGGFYIDPTYNLTPIFDAALTGEELPNPEVGEGAVVLFGAKTDRPRGMRLLSGRKASDTVAWLTKALGHLNDPAQAAKFKALEPDNGWGDVEGARFVIRKMIAAANEYPDQIWSIR
jgi:hypothetical protein